MSALLVSPAFAQKVSKENVRALNTARMQAESINGGLNNYRASKCMYATGKGGGNCLKNASDGYLFVFDGGSPGGKRLVVNPLLKLKFLSLEMELRLLMLSTTVHPVN